MDIHESRDLSDWGLELLARNLKTTDRLAVLVLRVERAELEDKGTRSQLLVLSGTAERIAAGSPPDRLDVEFYFGGAAPRPGDTAVALVRAEPTKQGALWAVVRFEPAAGEEADRLAAAVVSRLRALAPEDPFRQPG